jgi:UDP-glucose 4-epimerase
MYGFSAAAFRFGNVVGRRQTHGVGFDFIRRLLRDPTALDILGDGRQSKSYVWVGDIVDAVLMVGERGPGWFAAYNVATGDYITVREIADIACDCLGLDPRAVSYRFAGGDRGWKGDVPVVRLDISKIRSLGWKPTRGSAQAIRDAIEAMLDDIRAETARCACA